MSPFRAAGEQWQMLEGTILMSRKERERLAVLAQVTSGKLKLVTAGAAMGVGYRQAKRVWQRYQAQGDGGLVHRSRGRPSRRGKPLELRQQVLARYAERYPDFGPTLAAEYLAAEGLGVDHETLRRWLIAQGTRKVRRRGQRHRQWRERKECFGMMVQLDGSHHDWFEGRRAKAVLMVMVDDATNRVWAQFSEEETTRASYDVSEGWVRRWGLPQSLYVDRDSIYRCEGVGSVAEQMAGKGPQTQFGRAMEQLGVELILANSPQAKGRVERMNGLLQDRLVKALRLEGISDMALANEHLAKTFLPALNRRFQRQAASPADVHRAVPRNLDEVLSWEEERLVQRDWTVVSAGRWHQVEREHEPLGLAGKRVIVRTLRDGRVQLVHRGKKLCWRALPERPQRSVVKPKVQKPRVVMKPTAQHPWRQLGAGAGRNYWRGVKAAGRAERTAIRLGARDSGRPPLRSGLPASLAPSRGKERGTTTRKGDIFS
jgi:Homeodomain-like domain